MPCKKTIKGVFLSSYTCAITNVENYGINGTKDTSSASQKKPPVRDGVDKGKNEEGRFNDDLKEESAEFAEITKLFVRKSTKLLFRDSQWLGLASKFEQITPQKFRGTNGDTCILHLNTRLKDECY